MIEKVNDCVILPGLLDWSFQPVLSGAWPSEVIAGLQGHEARLTGRHGQLRGIRYQVLEKSANRSLLDARIREALKTGRAGCPIWPEVEWIGSTYTWGTLPATGGTRSWEPGEYVFLSRYRHLGVNRDELINFGGSASGSWQTSKWISGGSAATTTATIDTSLITGFAVPPQAVYQAAYNRSAATPGVIVITIPNLTRGVPCRLRMHFAELISGFNNSPNLRVMDVTVQGLTSTTFSDFSPYLTAGALNKAAAISLDITPSAAGAITITLTGKLNNGLYSAGINGLELYQYEWEVKLLDSGSGAGTLVFTEYPKGVYDQVCPMLWGRARADNWRQITDDLVRCQISVEEPPGESNPGRTSACSTEVEWETFPNLPTGTEPIYEHGFSLPEGWSFYGIQYYWGVGYMTQNDNPNTVITDSVRLAANLADLYSAWDLSLEKAAAIEVGQAQFLWAETAGFNSSFSAESKYPANGSGSEVEISGGLFGYLMIIPFKTS